MEKVPALASLTRGYTLAGLGIGLLITSSS